MTDFADDQPTIDKKKSKAQADRQINDFVVRQLMSTMPGRRWIWIKLSECHLYENQVFFEGDNAIQKTYFSAGERNVGLKLLADVMRLCPREYVLAMEENVKKEEDNGRRTRTGSDSGSDASSDGNAGSDAAGPTEA